MHGLGRLGTREFHALLVYPRGQTRERGPRGLWQQGAADQGRAAAVAVAKRSRIAGSVGLAGADDPQTPGTNDAPIAAEVHPAGLLALPIRASFGGKIGPLHHGIFIVSRRRACLGQGEQDVLGCSAGLVGLRTHRPPKNLAAPNPGAASCGIMPVHLIPTTVGR